MLAVLHEVLEFEQPDRLVPRRNPPERAGRYREQSAYLRDVYIVGQTARDVPDTPS